MSYIKGTYIEDIFSNQKNGYLVGLIRIKESSEEDKVNKVITFTGIFDELIYKATYKMEGDFVTHPKYGNQFVVKNYEIILPTEKEELIDFLSSDLFPIGEKTAERIVDKLGKDAIKLIQEDKSNLSGIPRLSKEKINKIAEKYRGGGHAQAAGAQIKDLSELDKFISRLDQVVLTGK